jgi:hypothetical protein
MGVAAEKVFLTVSRSLFMKECKSAAVRSAEGERVSRGMTPTSMSMPEDANAAVRRAALRKANKGVHATSFARTHLSPTSPVRGIF